MASNQKDAAPTVSETPQIDEKTKFLLLNRINEISEQAQADTKGLALCTDYS